MKPRIIVRRQSIPKLVFLIQKQTTGKRTGCFVSKANIYHWARKECWLKMLPTIMLFILHFWTPYTSRMLPSSLASDSLAAAAITFVLTIFKFFVWPFWLCINQCTLNIYWWIALLNLKENSLFKAEKQVKLITHLAPVEAISDVILAMPPGLSVMVTTNRTNLPSAARPRSIHRPKTVGSIFPPHSGTTTL